MNLGLAREVLQRLNQKGVREVVVCAGARNSPFLQVLDRTKGLKVFSFFEERSAGFFALGRMKAGAGPVAVITTSGTAVAELLPVVIEAYYTGFPLVVISADRPVSYRGSGAPQAIEQAGLFSNYVSDSMDISSQGDLAEFELGSKPLHINVCFDEPLLSGDDADWVAESSIGARPGDVASTANDNIAIELPLVIISTLTREQSNQVREIVSSWKVPVYAEGTSGLREIQLGTPHLNCEKDLYDLLQAGECRSIVRIGGVPTLRLWRDLESRFKETPVFNFSNLEFSGLSRKVEGHFALSDLGRVQIMGASALQNTDRDARLSKILFELPRAEPSMFRSLSSLVGDEVFVGNSLPIREWDLAADHSRSVHVVANRGANGIDGQLSTFLGWAQKSSEAWGVFGDLTTLYDLSSPWALQEQNGVVRIVVVNNGGGQIFSRLFENPKFRNPHKMGFESWADMWGMSYFKWTEVPSEFHCDQHCVIELVPEEVQSQKFWHEYDQL